MMRYTSLILQAAAFASASPIAQVGGVASIGGGSPAALTPVKGAAGAASLEDVATVGFATLNGGTSGGKGGQLQRVSTAEQLKTAAQGDAPTTILVTGKITQAGSIKVGSNKSIIGAGPDAELVGLGLSVKGGKNVIIRNLKISKVTADSGDAIAVQKATNVWIDHVDVSSDMTHDKDYYDGLIDLTHAADYVTISNTKLHDHFKASLVGHSDNNAAEDTGKLRVTYADNLWSNINSRAPSLRFGTGHIFNSVFINVRDGINIRKGAQALVENNSFQDSKQPLYSVDNTGGAVSKGNEGITGATIAAGKLTSVPYEYELKPVADIKASVPTSAGNTLTFA